MSHQHSFFVPDGEYLSDVSGFLSYLGNKIVIGNICLYCPNGGKEFGNLNSVRRHMADKAHCKLAYETEEDRAELADFYQYSSAAADEAGWEDIDMDSNVEIVSGNEVEEVCACGRLNADEQSALASLADDGLSLILPSGRTLGHRSLRIYYAQRVHRPSFANSKNDLMSAKVAEVRQRLADPSQAMVPISGGHGAYGKGLQVVRARNAGEASWARKQGRSFKDQRVKEDLRTKVGYIHNSQKRECFIFWTG